MFVFSCLFFFNHFIKKKKLFSLPPKAVYIFLPHFLKAYRIQPFSPKKIKNYLFKTITQNIYRKEQRYWNLLCGFDFNSPFQAFIFSIQISVTIIRF